MGWIMLMTLAAQSFAAMGVGIFNAPEFCVGGRVATQVLLGFGPKIGADWQMLLHNLSAAVLVVVCPLFRTVSSMMLHSFGCHGRGQWPRDKWMAILGALAFTLFGLCGRMAGHQGDAVDSTGRRYALSLWNSIGLGCEFLGVSAVLLDANRLLVALSGNKWATLSLTQEFVGHLVFFLGLVMPFVSLFMLHFTAPRACIPASLNELHQYIHSASFT